MKPHLGRPQETSPGGSQQLLGLSFWTGEDLVTNQEIPFSWRRWPCPDPGCCSQCAAFFWYGLTGQYPDPRRCLPWQDHATLAESFGWSGNATACSNPSALGEGSISPVLLLAPHLIHQNALLLLRQDGVVLPTWLLLPACPLQCASSSSRHMPSS